MIELSFTRIIGRRIVGVTTRPREPYLEIWHLLPEIVGQMRGARFLRRVGDVRISS